MSQSREPQRSASAGGAGSADMNQGMRVLSYLIAGIALYGGLGWGADHLLGTRFLLPVGLVFGAALAIYLVVRRFGGDPAASGLATGKPSTAADGTTEDEKGRV